MRREKLDELHSYLEELKTVKKVPLPDFKSKKAFLTSSFYECHLNCGKIIIRERLLINKKRGDAAVILALTHNDEVFLNVEPRVHTDETVTLALPAGYIEAGEKPSVAAERELCEELGVTADKLILLDEAYPMEGISSAKNYLFLALGSEQNRAQKLDESEIIRPFKCTFDEMLELDAMGYFKSLNSKLTIERAKQYLKRR